MINSCIRNIVTIINKDIQKADNFVDLFLFLKYSNFKMLEY